jgi:phosphoribosylformylglycinamidine synthase
MLCVVEPAQLEAVLAVCARWEVHGTAIGVVTDTRRLRVFEGDSIVGDMPVVALVDECPAYDLSPAEPTGSIYPAPPVMLSSSDPGEVLVALLGSSNVASRKWAFEQYDSIVGSRTVRRPEQADASVLLLPTPGGGDPLTSLYPSSNGAADGPRPAIAVAIDGNGRRVAADPYRGTVEAVVECSANLACVGAEPLGLTNCLNFGNPEKPHIAWQLTRSIAGLGDACRAFGIPVVGGNVSLYNEGAEGPIYPTPVVGLVGELPDARRSGRLGIAAAGDAIALVTAGWSPSLAASELAKLRGEVVVGPLPSADLGELKALHAAIRQAVRGGVVHSAHDVAEGGVAVALAEAALASGLGFAVSGLTSEEELFGEGPGAFVVSGPASALAAFGAAARVIGSVGGDTATIDGVLSVPLDELDRAFTYGLADLLH